MTDKINGRTPEEIKKGLECCKPVWVDKHWKACDIKCPYIDDVGGFCRTNLMADALAYIQQLEAERYESRNDLDTLNYAVTELHGAYEVMKRERNAAVEQLKEVDKEDLFGCTLCKHNVRCSEALLGCDDCDNSECPCNTCVDSSNWEWRGVQEVE